MKIINLIGLVLTVFILGAPSCNKTNPNAMDNEKVNLEFEGLQRHYLIHTPPSEFLESEVPLIFVLHGGGGTASGMPEFTEGAFNDLADKDGYIVVYPNGIEKQWNDGRTMNTRASREDINDVGFIKAIIDKVSNKYKVDNSRIFTCGISNGGFMSTRLSCDLSSTFKGAGIVTSQISKQYAPKCNPDTPVSIIIMNGTEDPLVPYDGGHIKILGQKRGEILSTDDYVDMWLGHNECKGEAEFAKLPDLDPNDECTVEKSTYSTCSKNSKVVLYKINGGGHTWPGGKKYLTEGLVGKVCRDINGYQVIWDFFKDLE